MQIGCPGSTGKTVERFSVTYGPAPQLFHTTDSNRESHSTETKALTKAKPMAKL